MSADAIGLDFELPLPRYTLRLRASLPGGLTAVMGPSGAGKTSLLEAVAGLRPRARGRILIGEVPLLDSAAAVSLPPERRRIGYVPQDAGLFPHLSVLANIRFGARADAPAVDAAIETLELRPLLGRSADALSGGERQRVALARALATRPRLLLLDEPLTGLDARLRERVLPWLQRIRTEWSLPCLYVTHNVGEAFAAASWALLLREGRLEAEGEPAALLRAEALVAEAEGGIENLMAARVVSHDAPGGTTQMSTASGLRVAVPLAPERPIGSAVTLAIRAEDVLVALSALDGMSARNLYPARVAAVERTGVDVTLRCALDARGEWLVRVTPAAVAALRLAPGLPVWLAVKSHSVYVSGGAARAPSVAVPSSPPEEAGQQQRLGPR